MSKEKVCSVGYYVYLTIADNLSGQGYFVISGRLPGFKFNRLQMALLVSSVPCDNI